MKVPQVATQGTVGCLLLKKPPAVCRAGLVAQMSKVPQVMLQELDRVRFQGVTSGVSRVHQAKAGFDLAV